MKLQEILASAYDDKLHLQLLRREGDPEEFGIGHMAGVLFAIDLFAKHGRGEYDDMMLLQSLQNATTPYEGQLA